MRAWAIALLVLLPAASAQVPDLQQQAVHNVFTIDALFAEWEAEYPDFVARMTIGQSEGGQPLHGIIVTDEAIAYEDAPHSAVGKYRVYLDGGHHGNEFLGVEITLYYIESLLDRASSADAEALNLLATSEIHVVPILNVEGNLRDTRVNMNGVDPNRNYDFGHTPCSIPGLTCGGPAPFSESEIRANADYLQAILPDLWLSMHTGIEVLYYPAGEPFPGGEAVDQPLFTAMEAPFEAVTEGRIDMVGGPAPAVGSAEDWGYAVVGVQSFVYEVHNDQNIPVYGEPVTDLLQAQIDGLAWLVEGAPMWGAHVEVVQEGQELRIRNDGWGTARNVTLQAGGTTWVVPEMAPRSDGPLMPVPADGEVHWSYPRLLVEASQTRSHEAVFTPVAVTQDEASPAAALPLLLAGLALLGRRRR